MRYRFDFAKISAAWVERQRSPERPRRSDPVPLNVARNPSPIGDPGLCCRCTSNSEDLANLFAAIMALKALPWPPASMRDIRAEHWSDLTRLVKS